MCVCVCAQNVSPSLTCVYILLYSLYFYSAVIISVIMFRCFFLSYFIPLCSYSSFLMNKFSTLNFNCSNINLLFKLLLLLVVVKWAYTVFIYYLLLLLLKNMLYNFFWGGGRRKRRVSIKYVDKRYRSL